MRPSGYRALPGIDRRSDWGRRDAEAIEALGGLAEQKAGLGFWKLYDRLRQARHDWNHKRL
ncbi:hypothetical protein [Thiohalobacter sp.]|uniref:hypothetical protein n=1 Tax=Thiohalobacter sp. TaxID=2025948 RepID=UPI002614141A|nr:hypothetical protein [Thiohalobacter sp.]